MVSDSTYLLSTLLIDRQMVTSDVIRKAVKYKTRKDCCIHVFVIAILGYHVQTLKMGEIDDEPKTSETNNPSAVTAAITLPAF